jgi:hypothetical protein
MHGQHIRNLDAQLAAKRTHFFGSQRENLKVRCSALPQAEYITYYATKRVSTSDDCKCRKC